MASRAKRLQRALDNISPEKEMIEELRDELQDWLDNMPENLQGGQKAEQLEAAIDELDQIIDTLDEVVMSAVDFPGMF